MPGTEKGRFGIEAALAKRLAQRVSRATPHFRELARVLLAQREAASAVRSGLAGNC